MGVGVGVGVGMGGVRVGRREVAGAWGRRPAGRLSQGAGGCRGQGVEARAGGKGAGGKAGGRRGRRGGAGDGVGGAQSSPWDEGETAGAGEGTAAPLGNLRPTPPMATDAVGARGVGDGVGVGVGEAREGGGEDELQGRAAGLAWLEHVAADPKEDLGAFETAAECVLSDMWDLTRGLEDGSSAATEDGPWDPHSYHWGAAGKGGADDGARAGTRAGASNGADADAVKEVTLEERIRGVRSRERARDVGEVLRVWAGRRCAAVWAEFGEVLSDKSAEEQGAIATALPGDCPALKDNEALQRLSMVLSNSAAEVARAHVEQLMESLGAAAEDAGDGDAEALPGDRHREGGGGAGEEYVVEAGAKGKELRESFEQNVTVYKMDRTQAAQLFMGSLEYGYFLCELDRRYKAERRHDEANAATGGGLGYVKISEPLGNDIEILDVDQDGMPLEGRSMPGLDLLSYIQDLDDELLQRAANVATIETWEAACRYTGRLFGLQADENGGYAHFDEPYGFVVEDDEEEEEEDDSDHDDDDDENAREGGPFNISDAIELAHLDAEIARITEEIALAESRDVGEGDDAEPDEKALDALQAFFLSGDEDNEDKEVDVGPSDFERLRDAVGELAAGRAYGLDLIPMPPSLFQRLHVLAILCGGFLWEIESRAGLLTPLTRRPLPDYEFEEFVFSDSDDDDEED